MRNAITYTVLATFIALGTVATGFAEQAKAPPKAVPRQIRVRTCT